MKRITILLALLVYAIALHAQPLNEGFEGTNFPTDWKLLDNNNDGFWWRSWIGPSEAHSGNNFAGSYSYNQNGPLTPDNWMITPRLTVNSSTDSISYWVATADPAYPAEHYAVLVSTTDTNTTDFSTVLYETTLTAADATWKRKSFSLSAFVGQNIYIAFRHYNCTDNFQIKIDDVSGPELYKGTGTNVKDEKFGTLKVYPQPANDVLNFELESRISSIRLFNIVGEQVFYHNPNSNRYLLDVQSFSKGIYIAQIESYGVIKNIKVIIK